ncbi:hypothetical protein [Arachidicoccus ginsenosidimutans]|uniref:hypothetical protein n=1 Tax=Arachidicoccus sp. BS20 TaxID=1850526 RepID=UPI0012E82442|nr:hypothetical protein [Arachidicoccus sp. BS20]
MKKKLFFFILSVFTAGFLNAQVIDSANVIADTTTANIPTAGKTSSTEAVGNKWANYDLSHRGGDHFIFQFGFLGWGGATGDYKLHGFSRQFNAAFMLDHVFKSNPHFSLGYGLGYASDNFFLNGKYADIVGKSSSSSTFEITENGGGGTSFKKFKIVNTYLEIPLELRFSKNVVNPAHGFRVAVGLKGGWMVNAHSKGKNEINSAGTSMYGTGYIEKEYSKRYFNTTRLDGTLRIGLGMFNIYGTYQLTSLLKSGAGPTLHPYSIGFGLSIM